MLVNAFLLVGNLIALWSKDARRTTGPFSGLRWFGQLDGSYSELFGHVALLAAAVLLGVIWHVRREAVYGVWALVLGVLVADDFLRLHERLGAALVRMLGLPGFAGLRPQDFGELLTWAIPAPFLGAALLFAHLRSHGLARQHSWMLIVLVGALGAFAVVVDMAAHLLHSFFSLWGNRTMTLIESVGEVGVMCLFLLAVHHMYRTVAAPPPGRHRRRRHN